MAKGKSQCANSHAYRAHDEQRFAAKFLHSEDGYKRKGDIHYAHHHGLHHGVAHSYRLEDTRRIIEHRIDAYHLLEDREHDANEDHERTIGEQRLGLLHCSSFDLREGLASHLFAVDLREHSERFVVLSAERQIARRFRNKADKHGEESGWHSLRDEHHAPAYSLRPSNKVGERLHCPTHNQVIDKIHHELAEDDSKLVPTHERTAFVSRCHLSDIHGADSRCEAHTNAAQHAIQVERHQQVLCRYAFFKEKKLRIIRA